MSSCGCGSNKETAYMESSCGLVPEYDPGCHECGGVNTYGFEECVFICRDGQRGEHADVYESLVEDNKDHPVEGARKSTPTWVLRSVCEAFRPKPIVQGDGVVKTVDPITNQVTYTINSDTDTNTTYGITQNNDGSQTFVGSDGTSTLLNVVTPIPNTDRQCKSTAFTDPQTGTTTVSETCFDKDGNIISGPTPFLTIEKGAIDTINAISEPDADGKIYITRPDLSVECVYDCDGVQKLIDGIKPVCIPSGVQSIGTGILGEFEVIYGTTTPDEPDGGNGVEHYYVEPRCLTFGADCPAGIPITVRAHMDAGLLVTKPSRKGDPQYLGNCSQQWGMIAFLDGVEVKRTFDMYCLDDFGGRENASSSFTFDTVTTGQPMEVCLASLVQVANGSWEAGDIFGIDIAESDVGITVI